MPGFPSAAEPVYVGGGLWLRVVVLTLAEAMKGKDAIRVAVNIARGAQDYQKGEIALTLEQQKEQEKLEEQQ
jgi:hypothetical protein